MSKAQDELRELLKVYNAWDYIKKGLELGVDPAVGVIYSTQESGRMYRPASWAVIRPGFKTDPNAHWMDHGTKTFKVYTPSDKADKEAQLAQAIAWATERYGYDTWVRCQFPGVWVPQPIYQVVTHALTKARKEARSA